MGDRRSEVGDAAQQQHRADSRSFPVQKPLTLTWRDLVIIAAFAIATGGVAATVRGVWGFVAGFAAAGASVAIAMMVGRWTWGLIPRWENETVAGVFYNFLYIPVGGFALLSVAAGSMEVFTGAAGPGQLVAFIVAAGVLGSVIAGRIFIKPPPD